MCNTQAKGHVLHESKNGRHYYLLTNVFFAWLRHLGPTGPGTQHQASQVQQPACLARQCGHTPNKCAKQGQTNPHRMAPNSRQNYCVTPIGGSHRTSERRKQHGLHRIWNISCIRLDGSAQFTDGCFLATCMLQCCGSLQRSRLPLTEQQATANQLQLKQCKGIALRLWATKIGRAHV